MRHPIDPARRLIVLGGASFVMLGVARAATVPTPRQSEGPFYPRRMPGDRDFDLTEFGAGPPEGEVIEVVGRVTDVRASPLPGAVVELWQADARGFYPNVGMGGADPNFQGYGAVRTGSDGEYRFRTIRPALYASRTRHLHFKVIPAAGSGLTTQMYFPGEPANERDGLFRSIPEGAPRQAVIATVEGGSPPRLRFDIVLG
ncbi:MAG TPA: protocatechuate 3,4-dioxygenase [Afifellaceae bacterium]|nr:protocatechuate 3,4-dioxygenase [Afifellaceae bacterium]